MDRKEKISINEYLIQMSNIYLCIDSNKKGSEHNAKEAGTLQFNNVNSLVYIVKRKSLQCKLIKG